MNKGTYSKDLRKRVIEYVENGGSKKQACTTYNIGHNTIYRWLRQRKESKTFDPKRREIFYRKCDAEKLKGLIKQSPDATLKELGKKLKLQPSTIFYALERLKMTRKKKLHLQRA
jgi:putative transposase